VASLIISVLTLALSQLGSSEKERVAIPAMWGLAMEVPEMVRMAVLLPI